MITIKTLNQHSAQEVFDQAVNHMLTQNKKSKTDLYSCSYRGSGGLKCAAGCFISDEEYNKAMEGNTWAGIEKELKAKTIHDDMIEQLQEIHDDESVSEWKVALYAFAVKNNLKFNTPQ